MGAASDIVLVEPVGVEGTQHAQHVKQRLRVEDVIDDALQKNKHITTTSCYTNNKRYVYTKNV